MFVVTKDVNFEKTVYLNISGELDDADSTDEDTCRLNFDVDHEVEVEVEQEDIDDLSPYELEELIDAISLHAELGNVVARLSQQTVKNLEAKGVYTNLVSAIAEEGSK